MSYNKYALAQFLIDFEPGSRVGVAKADFTTHRCSAGSYLPEEIKKGDVCEFTEYGIKKIPRPGYVASTECTDNAALQDILDRLLGKGSKVPDAEHMARSEGRATTGTDSSSESSTESRLPIWQKHMLGDLLSPPVQLDYREKMGATPKIRPANI